MKFLILFALIISISTDRPIAYIYGLNSDCEETKPIYESLQKGTNRIVKCIDYGKTKGNFEDQCKKACEKINEDSDFDNEFDIVGFSQGGVIGRYIVEFCNGKDLKKKKVHTYISMGSPHMGTYKVGHNYADEEKHPMLFKIAEKSLQTLTKFPYIKHLSTASAYIRDAKDLKKYQNSFLARLNNEQPEVSEIIKKNVKKRFSSLKKVVLICFNKDDKVIPPESSLFYQYDGQNYVDIKHTQFYKKDLLGYKQLEKDDKIDIVKLDTGHDCLEECIDKLIDVLEKSNKKSRIFKLR